MKLHSFVVSVLLLATCFSAVAADQYVSLAALIATPERYAEKRIITAGFLSSGHRGFQLYLHQDDATNSLGENSIGLAPAGSEAKSRARLDGRSGRYVRIKGTFHAYPPKKVVVHRGYVGVLDVILPDEFFSE